MHDHGRDPWVFDRSGGQLALDFANTLSDRHGEQPIERVPDYPALVSFARQSDVVTDDESERLLRWAARHRAEAEAIHGRVLALRDALYWLFAHVADGRPPREHDLATLNAWLPRLALGPDLAWRWADGERAPDALMLPILSAALDLLRSPSRDRVRTCDAETCRWLFLDTSKNRSRRWCDMKQCGNREKARRFASRRAGTSHDH